MIKFFRNIRQNLLNEGKTTRYFKYAIGEIVLVVIGILIALQINNWNEIRKGKITEHESYENLLTSLEKDSLELITIISYQIKSLAEQNRFIHSNYLEIKESMSIEQISNSLNDVYFGAYSFFPKYGTYNALMSNEGIDLLRSKKIKSMLIELYDYQFKKYEDRDAVIDHKFMTDFIPFVQRKLGFFVDSNFDYDLIDQDVFEKNYDELVIQCKNLNVMLTQSIKSLNEIQKTVNELILLIKTELKDRHWPTTSNI